MNEVCLQQKHSLVEMLKNYLNHQENFPFNQLFHTFQKTYIGRYLEKEKLLTQLNSQQYINSQDILNYEVIIQNLEVQLTQIRVQRQALHQKMDIKENELQKLEQNILQSEQVIHKVESKQDFEERLQYKKEECGLLQEENQEFGKLLAQLRKKNTVYKQRFLRARDLYEQNIQTLNELQQQGLNLNYRMMKQLKIIKDLGNLNSSVAKKPKLENFVSNYCPLEDTQELYKNFEKVQGSDLAENIQQIIALKNELASINMREETILKYEKEELDQVLTSSQFRYKTHHNLGERLIRQRQISQQDEEFKAFSELNEEENSSKQDESEKLIEMVSQKQPWYYKSAMPGNRQQDFNEQIEFYSDKKGYYTKSSHSIKSFASESSCKWGVMTLKQEFDNINPQINEDIKEKDTEINDSGELPHLIQEESIKQDSTIIINRKLQSSSISNVKKIELKQEKQEKFQINLKATGVVLATVGVLGWLYKKYF